MTRPTVLFVCVHNAGRSQMAAGYLQHLGGGRVEVLSAGSEPTDRVNPVAVAAMAEVGIDIAAEQPKILTNDAVKASDVVITMGCGDILMRPRESTPHLIEPSCAANLSSSGSMSISLPSSSSRRVQKSSARALTNRSLSKGASPPLYGVTGRPSSSRRSTTPPPTPGTSTIARATVRPALLRLYKPACRRPRP